MPVQRRTGVYRDNFLFFYHCTANLITSRRVTDYEVHRNACNALRTQKSAGCPTTYQTRHFFNNSKTNEDIATRFEQEYVRCVRNEEECVCSACLFCCNIFIGFRIIKEMPGLVGSGTFYTIGSRSMD